MFTHSRTSCRGAAPAARTPPLHYNNKCKPPVLNSKLFWRMRQTEVKLQRRGYLMQENRINEGRGAVRNRNSHALDEMRLLELLLDVGIVRRRASLNEVGGECFLTSVMHHVTSRAPAEYTIRKIMRVVTRGRAPTTPFDRDTRFRFRKRRVQIFKLRRAGVRRCAGSGV
ncbi:hypothetical protein EVAR_50855_1 [Eumeta japonica]|uniref:Uncharacterized protein n=1 Tax=Eumeta variegata TaxID=151549 RepID=A0A4C1Y859_EUMVA|nr:hypothetical protein EVAR_50855_1 [Eumeta japonica]